MMMSDGTLVGLHAKGELEIVPTPEQIQWQPCSVDLRLGTSFRDPVTRQGHITNEYRLRPLGFVLANTKERVRMGKAFVGTVHGRSSWARRGLQVHAAGLVDPGFDGEITLELFNMSSAPITICTGERICQLTVQRLDWPAARPYGHPELGSKYQGQTGATEGR